MTRVLLVEDEPAVADPLTYLLQREGFEIVQATDGGEALHKFGLAQVDLVLLDLMLPVLSGMEVARRIRAVSPIPIIMLTAADSEADVVRGLESGADDYVTKPYSSTELLARIRAALRRMTLLGVSQEHGPLQSGPVRLDVNRHALFIRGHETALPPKEFELLAVLLRNSGRALSRVELLDGVWGPNYPGDNKTLEVHIRRIREKIEKDPSEPRLLVTVRGLGYRFEELPSDS